MVGDGQLKHWHMVAQGQLQGFGICRTLFGVHEKESDGASFDQLSIGAPFGVLSFQVL